MVAKEIKIEPVERKKSVISKKAKKSCLSSTTRSGIKYAIAWVAYVLIGSWIFLVLEETKDVIQVEHHKWTKLKELLSAGEVVEELLELRLQLHQLCHGHWFNETFDELLLSNTVKVAASNESDILIEVFQPNYTQQWREQTESGCVGKLIFSEEITKYPDWTFVDAIYYTMTLVTTIGFGHISPSTDMGRIFCVAYSLAGVPLTCIFCAKSSDVLSNRMLKLYETAKRRYRRQPKTVLYAVTWLFLLLGCFIFMYLPCIAFAYLEDWSYVESFYFTFITLATIGFGDYIAGYGSQEQPYPEVYKISIVIWIMCGLGYWFLLLNFLQKAIKSNAKAFKKSFVGKKNIVKQAEFLRHVMAKVKQEENSQPTKEEINEKLNMMALMIESISSAKTKPSFERQESGFSMKKSISKTSMSALNDGKSVLRRLSTDSVNLVSKMFGSFTSKSSIIFEHLPGTEEEHTVQIEEEDEQPLTDDEKDAEEVPLTTDVAPKISFSDLMKVNVSLKTDTFREFESLVGQANFENEPQNDDDNGINLNFHTSPSFSEVTLPLRDVLGIVLLVASMDQEEEDHESTSDDSQLTVTSTGPIVDPRESVPLLRNIFLSYIGNNSATTNKEEKQPRPNPLTLEERETIKNAYFETALNTYLEECGTTPDEVLEDISDDDACRKG